MSISFLSFFPFLDNIFHLDVNYVCILVQRFEPQGRRLKLSIIIIIIYFLYPTKCALTKPIRLLDGAT